MKNNIRKIMLFLLIAGMLIIAALWINNYFQVESGGVMVKGW